LERLADPGAILFDLDGTLVDTVPVRVAAWMEAFAEAGIPADPARVGLLMGMDGRRVVRETAASAGVEVDDDAAEALDQRSGELFDARNIAPRALPGAGSLLRALASSSVRWAVVTSSRPAQVDASVRALALDGPPIVIDASHVVHAKPAPDLLLAAAGQLGLPPGSCWYVGDSPADMGAAHAAGMPAIGVPTGAVDGQALQDAGATAVVEGLDELAAGLRDRGLIAR
jgi:HAD superfamily hydrolase (TIGR01509 family)